MILGGIWSRRTAAIFVISGLKFLLYSVEWWKCTMEEEEKQVTPRCKKMPPQLYFGGRTPPAIKLIFSTPEHSTNTRFPSIPH